MNKNKILYLSLIIFMLPLPGFGIDIYAPLLPSMPHYFNASSFLIKMTISVYLIGLCIGQVIFGFLSDSFGRKNILIYGGLFFFIVSVFLQVLSSIEMNLLFRFLQGFFAGSVAVSCRSIARDVFKENEIQEIAASMSIAWSIGPIVAPLLGVYLMYYFGWKSTFSFLALYGLVIFTLAFFMKETHHNKSALSVSRALSDYRLILRERSFTKFLLLMAFAYSSVVIFSLTLPFLAENQLHASILLYGHYAFIIGIAYLLGTIINRVLLRWISSTELINYSLATIVLAIALLMLLSYKSSLFNLFAPAFILIMSTGVLFPNCLAGSINILPHMAGKVSAVVGSAFMCLTSVVLCIVSYIKIHNQFSLSLALTLFFLLIFSGYRLVINSEK